MIRSRINQIHPINHHKIKLLANQITRNDRNLESFLSLPYLPSYYQTEKIICGIWPVEKVSAGVTLGKVKLTLIPSVQPT